MIVNNISQQKYSGTKYTPSFKAYMPEGFYKYAEKQSIKAEFTGRKLITKTVFLLTKCAMLYNTLKNKITLNQPKFNYEALKKELQNILKMDEASASYMGIVYNFSRLICAGKEIEINIENNELQNIADSDEACIFIMNHDKQKEDPKLLTFFNALLAREYILKDKASGCPRPKVILNKDILDSSDDLRRKLCEKWGAVGVDATIHCTNHIYNGRATSKLIREFEKDKINLFIFPEGRMCAFSSLNPEWKFQGGISDIIRAAAQRKSRVKVVPLGFAYKKDTGAIHIGEPVYFKQDGNRMLFTPGVQDKRFSNPKFLEFIQTAEPVDEEGYLPITENGKDVNIRKARDFISGILCDNLVVSKKLAAESIKNTYTDKDTDIIYSISEKGDEPPENINPPFMQRLIENVCEYFVKRMKNSKFSANPDVHKIEQDLANQGINVRFKGNLKLADTILQGINNLRDKGINLPQNILFFPSFIPFIRGSSIWYKKLPPSKAPIFLSRKIMNKKSDAGNNSLQDINHTLYHEIGHWLQFQNNFVPEINYKLWAEQADIRRIKDIVSERAVSLNDGSEFCAEVFAGQIEGRQYPDDILAFAEKLGGTVIRR